MPLTIVFETKHEGLNLKKDNWLGYWLNLIYNTAKISWEFVADCKASRIPISSFLSLEEYVT